MNPKYINGREAKIGDRVIDTQTGNLGVLYEISDMPTCNGRIARSGTNDPFVNLEGCVLLEDVKRMAAVGYGPVAEPPPR